MSQPLLSPHLEFDNILPKKAFEARIIDGLIWEIHSAKQKDLEHTFRENDKVKTFSIGCLGSECFSNLLT